MIIDLGGRTAIISGSTGGIGLAIARGLAEAQGGSLTVHARPGGGSVFRLCVPVAELPVS